MQNQDGDVKALRIELSHKVRHFHKLQFKPDGIQVKEIATRGGAINEADEYSISSTWLLILPYLDED